MAKRSGVLRITFAFLLAPVGAIAFWYTLAAAWLLASGEKISVLDVLQGIFMVALVASPMAYAVQAVLLLAFGVRPPEGWRGLASTVAIGLVAGALALGGWVHFLGHVIGEDVARFSLVGAMIGGAAAFLYTLIVGGMPSAKPAV